MTIIEILSDEIIDNVIASLKFNNDRVIYIGYERKKMENSIINIRNYFNVCERNIEIDGLIVCRNNLKDMVDKVSNLVEGFFQEEDYIFDVTGGDDLILVAIGIVAAKYNIELITTNYKGKVVWQTDNLKNISVLNKKAKIGVRENIVLHGGEIVGPNNIPGIFPKWKFTDEFVQDLYNMWEICRNDCVRWNREIGEIQHKINKNEQLIHGNVNKTMQSLIDIGVLIRDESYNKEVYAFKNVQIKESLMKVGNVLELYICIVASKMMNDDNSRLFHDVKMGVCIDWDGIIHDIHDKEKDTRNEIDVLLMKGVIPIFVSCKNGEVNIDELYKLNAVAEKFGGKYAKKVLVLTYFGKKGASYEYFMQRAKDMKITIINECHKLKIHDLENILSNI